MNVHDIAGLKVGLDYSYPRLRNQAAAYICEEQPTNFNIQLSKEFLLARQKESPHLTLENCEYIWTGSCFYHYLVHFSGMLLHASAVIYNGYAYLFSAPSGTGKSTHTQLWCRTFPGAEILNDDKPAIRILQDGIYVYGTPWSGKTSLNLNKKVPLGGICFLERSMENFIEKMDSKEAIGRLLNQTVRPAQMQDMDLLLQTMDKLLTGADVYRMGCNISEDAAFVAYSGMNDE